MDSVATRARPPTGGTTLLVSLTLGHMAVHWFQQLWPLIIPSLKAGVGLSSVELGILSSVRQFTVGPLMLPSGILADLFRQRTRLILVGAVAALGASHLLVGLSRTYAWLLPSIALVGIGTALWHPAAVASLSRRFPQRRGSVLAVHGVGASIGDTLAPLAIGALLLALDWRTFLGLQVIPAVLVALLLWRSLGSIYAEAAGTRPSLRSYWTDLKGLLRHRVVLAIVGVNVFTGMARVTTLTFLPIYLTEHLGYSTFLLGVHVTLLYAMGAASQPALGYLSDRFGRQAVLLPSLVVFGLLHWGLVPAAPGLPLALVIGALGLFFYALATVTQATVMDVATEQVQASTMGVTTFLGQILTLPAPIIAGFVVTGFDIKAAFVFSGCAILLGALLLAVVRVPPSSRPTPRFVG